MPPSPSPSPEQPVGLAELLPRGAGPRKKAGQFGDLVGRVGSLRALADQLVVDLAKAQNGGPRGAGLMCLVSRRAPAGNVAGAARSGVGFVGTRVA